MQSNKRTDLTPGWCGDLPVRYYHSQGSGLVTVVFIHGFTLTAQSYFQQVDFLHYRYPESAAYCWIYGGTATAVKSSQNCARWMPRLMTSRQLSALRHLQARSSSSGIPSAG